MTDTLVLPPPKKQRTRRKAVAAKASAVKALYVKYKQPIRGFMGWAGGLIIQVVTQNGGPEQVQNWNRHRWMLALIAAAIPGIAMWMRGGDKNPSAEDMATAVARVEAERENQTRTTGRRLDLPPTGTAQS